MATKIVSVSEVKTRLANLMDLLEKLDDLEDMLAMRQALSSPEEEAIKLGDYVQEGVDEHPRLKPGA